MSDSDLIRKAITILNESVLEDGKEWKRTKAQQDFDKEFDDVPRDEEDDEEDSDAHDKMKDREHDDEEDAEMDETVEEEDESTESAPKKEAAPKAPNKSKVDWASHSFPGMGEGIYEGEELEEGVNITLDGPEADEFVARLMQLSGQPVPTQPPAPLAAGPVAVDAVPVPADMDGAPAADMDEPAGIPIDQPAVDADHYVCDACHNDPCECDSTAGMVAMEETAEHDNVNTNTTDGVEEVDDANYMWEPVVTKQRLVKGVMGDNPMVEESIERFNKIVNDYVSFLNEGEAENDDGHASPLTANARQEFEKDPNVSKTPKDDGSMSPMSQIERQDVAK
jgi:hypothetical protein